jgi:hypothetical protein
MDGHGLKIMELNKNYSLDEIKELAETDEEAKQFMNSFYAGIELSKIQKPIIESFDSFDENTKNIYLSIAKEIKDLNPNQEDLKVLATGSRVKGKWRSEEESNVIKEKYNLSKIKYSDYDIMTNAINNPDFKLLAQKLNIRKIDKTIIVEKRSIEIPLN